MTRAILIDHNASTRPVRRSALNGVVDSAESVSNIQEALNAMRRERFDVVVAAIDPSSDDGRSLLEHSRAPVVMLTQSDARQEAIRRGAFDALVTTDHDVLVRAAVQRALNSRSATGGEARPDMSLQAREPDDMPTLEQIEQYYVDQVLTATRGNKTQAARVLGVDRRTLYRKLDRWAAAGTPIPSAGS